MHADHLGCLRLITQQNGTAAKSSIYKPFGEVIDFTLYPTFTDETKGFICERYDADSGLQYRNARYYDTQLALFIQPDWFEVMQKGVGTKPYVQVI
ncbi:RHS repeat domain-containing protein [Pseudaestuariivita rosea]|uniref:RHS repeat domain-containing protein n=1 Tax=Pseudaestuariivita rosea TaxID=2763263 RepID=UPI003AF558B3